MFIRELKILRSGEPSGGGAEPTEPASPEPEVTIQVTPEATPQEPAAPEAKPEPSADKTKPSEAPKEDWKDKRIATLTARAKEMAEKLKQFEQPLEAKPLEPAKPLDPTEDFNKRVNERAAQQVAAQRFAEQCNAAAQQGRQQFADFGEKVKQLQQVVDSNNPKEVAAYQNFLQAGLETGELPFLIHALGSDPNEAQRILELSPVKMAIELTRMAAGKPQVESVSQVPKPLRPIGGGHSVSPIDPTDKGQSDKLSTEEWMRRREEQVSGQRKR